jgi:hypothetical protein
MDLLDRLHARLQAALDGRSGGPDEPFTVGELYQQLIPYRAVRGELALLELAPYEHALLRLLAGERGYLELSEPAVVDDLRRELREPNPILGVYRDYASVEVRLASAAGAADGAADEVADRFVAPPLPPPLPLKEDRVGERESPATHDHPSAPGKAGNGGRGAEDGDPRAGSSPPAPCTRCGEELPEVEGLRFCPTCGAEQREPSCAGCGAQVDPAWSFCVHCGVRQG